MPKRRSVKSADDRPADAHVRGRDYLGQPDVDRLLVASKKSRHGVRDHLLILMMFRHGLRVSETIALRRQDVDLAQSRVWIARLKNGLSVEQPVAGDELRAIKRWLARREDALPCERQQWAETVRRLEGLLAAAPTSPFLRSCDELRSICFRIREPLIASSHAPGSRIEAGRTVDRWLRKFSVVRGIACNASKLRQPCCRKGRFVAT